jgi:hypothetical protein
MWLQVEVAFDRIPERYASGIAPPPVRERWPSRN